MKNKHRPIIGIMGPGTPDNNMILPHAEKLGRKIAEKGWVLLTGGRHAGVMNAASKGAFEAGGEVIGILPKDSKSGMSPYVTIPIISGMGSARNVINILTSDVVIVCGMGFGTASEAALALKHSKPVLFTMVNKKQNKFFNDFLDHPLTSIDELKPLIQYIELLVR